MCGRLVGTVIQPFIQLAELSRGASATQCKMQPGPLSLGRDNSRGISSPLFFALTCDPAPQIEVEAPPSPLPGSQSTGKSPSLPTCDVHTRYYLQGEGKRLSSLLQVHIGLSASAWQFPL